MKQVIIIITLLCLLWFTAQSETLVIYEKNSNGQWVRGVKVLPEDADPGQILLDIEANPDERVGSDFAIYRGVRGYIKESSTTGETSWELDATAEGSIVVFWNIAGSSDPAEYFTSTFSTKADADTFINEVKNDPTLALWDERPFKVAEKWVSVPGETTTMYEIVF